MRNNEPEQAPEPPTGTREQLLGLQLEATMRERDALFTELNAARRALHEATEEHRAGHPGKTGETSDACYWCAEDWRKLRMPSAEAKELLLQLALIAQGDGTAISYAHDLIDKALAQARALGIAEGALQERRRMSRIAKEHGLEILAAALGKESKRPW